MSTGGLFVCREELVMSHFSNWAKKHAPVQLKFNAIKDSNPTFPAYAKLRDDGAMFRCMECGERAPAASVLYILTPNGARGVYHIDCLDDEWLAAAVEIKLVE
jgi:hypothetical protein